MTEQEVIPFIPTETEIDQLIAACRLPTAALLQFLIETGARARAENKLKMRSLLKLHFSYMI